MPPAPITATRIGAQYRVAARAKKAYLALNARSTWSQLRVLWTQLPRDYNRRALGKRGILLVWWAVLMALLGTTSVALAEPRVTLDPAPDGSLVLFGRGWRPAQRMMVSVGRDEFQVQADSVGDFEVPTGLAATGGPQEPLAVHRPYHQVTPAMLALIHQTDTPHPFAVLFAQSLLTGLAFAGLGAAGLGLTLLAARIVRTRRP
jgi:hypothetical protein